MADLENKVISLEKRKGKIRPIKTRMPIDGDIRPVKKDAVFDRIFTLDDLAEDIYLERSGRRIRKKMGGGELRPVTATSKKQPLVNPLPPLVRVFLKIPPVAVLAEDCVFCA